VLDTSAKLLNVYFTLLAIVTLQVVAAATVPQDTACAENVATALSK